MVLSVCPGALRREIMQNRHIMACATAAKEGPCSAREWPASPPRPATANGRRRGRYCSQRRAIIFIGQPSAACAPFCRRSAVKRSRSGEPAPAAPGQPVALSAGGCPVAESNRADESREAASNAAPGIEQREDSVSKHMAGTSAPAVAGAAGASRCHNGEASFLRISPSHRQQYAGVERSGNVLASSRACMRCAQCGSQESIVTRRAREGEKSVRESLALEKAREAASKRLAPGLLLYLEPIILAMKPILKPSALEGKYAHQLKKV